MSKRSYAGIEVYGANVRILLEAFGHFKSAASKILLQHGLGKKGADGMAEFVPDAWYSFDANIRAMEEIGAQGEAVMYQAGKLVPTHFPFPPQIKDVPSALGSLDVAYHMNHRLNGQVMFDAATGKMTEGIGHYRYEPGVRPGEATVVCDNPYPCALDRGIVVGLVRRFATGAALDHAPQSGCRSRGASACVYKVTWNV